MVCFHDPMVYLYDLSVWLVSQGLVYTLLSLSSTETTCRQLILVTGRRQEALHSGTSTGTSLSLAGARGGTRRCL